MLPVTIYGTSTTGDPGSCCAVSIFGAANGGVVFTVAGPATSSPGGEAVSLIGNASGAVAISGAGNAQGTFVCVTVIGTTNGCSGLVEENVRLSAIALVAYGEGTALTAVGQAQGMLAGPVGTAEGLAGQAVPTAMGAVATATGIVNGIGGNALGAAAVSTTGPADGSVVGVSLQGNASGPFAVSGTGDSTGGVVAVSLSGKASSCTVQVSVMGPTGC
jgi:hypothetical protein